MSNGIATPADTPYCEDCEQDFPREELTNAWEGNPFGLVRLWCNECRDSYDPTPYEQWEVTTPAEVYTVVEDEYGRVYN